MRIKWLSLKRLKIHEVHSTIRWLKADPITWPERSKVYSRIQERAITTTLKFIGPSLVGYLIATSLRSENKILLKIASYEVSVPAAYFLFTLSVIFLFLLISLNNLSTAISLKSSIAGKIQLPGFGIGAYEAINENDELSLGLPTGSFGYWREVLHISTFVGVLLSLSLASLTIPIGALGYFLAQQQISILLDSNAVLAERTSAGFGLLSISTGILSFLIFHLPMPFSKNARYVRWGFLWKLPISTSDDERTSRWLGKE